ncbi:hypothetical protein IIZ72_00855 [Candidatus Saccharibacteria bacterium]|nr:hypothetical protein [Candidatus Saccharibacteria bacterium]
MDNLSENWEKKKKIKAEVEKAEQASMAESKANLANIDARTFMVGKGLSYNIEAYRTGSEKISSIALVLIVLGVIADAIIFFVATHLKMGLADLLPSMIDDAIYVLFVVAPAVAAVFAIIEAAIYIKKTGVKLWEPIISSSITIVIYLIWQSIRLLIAGI